MNKKKTTPASASFLILIITFLILIVNLVIQIKKEVDSDNAYLEELKQSLASDRAYTQALISDIEYHAQIGSNAVTQEVIFTNYGTWDGTSGNTTASGLKIKDFEVNEDGFYTHNGYVVLATANTSRLNKKLNNGYKSHELGEIISFELNGKQYHGKALDVCGACYGLSNEQTQRYDIFTTSNVIGKKQGVIYE